MEFCKYHGNGNDFVIVNNIKAGISLSSSKISLLCDRHFGIGADGLILVNESDISDFEMVYYNSDGNIGSMCGNGGRCVAAFAYSQGIASSEMLFEAFDGLHQAIINNKDEGSNTFNVSLKMADVEFVEKNENYFFLDTGSPHYVEFIDNVADFNVQKSGRKTRYSEKFHPDGTNVNFAELSEERVFVRTYERGVEAETLSCGTGVTASAIASYFKTGKTKIDIHTLGGDLKVWFKVENNKFVDLWLNGAAVEVFNGFVNID